MVESLPFVPFTNLVRIWSSKNWVWMNMILIFNTSKERRWDVTMKLLHRTPQLKMSTRKFQQVFPFKTPLRTIQIIYSRSHSKWDNIRKWSLMSFLYRLKLYFRNFVFLINANKTDTELQKEFYYCKITVSLTTFDRMKWNWGFNTASKCWS